MLGRMSRRGEEEEESQSLSMRDAYMFPLLGSVVLFSMYLAFRFFPAYIQPLINLYFSGAGLFAVHSLLERYLRKVGPTWPLLRTPTYFVDFGTRTGTTKEMLQRIRFTHLTLVSLTLAAGLTALYMYTKHWTLSNLFGLAFSTKAIQLITLDSFVTGVVLLSGLFLYDVFWVFGTDVMVTVAKSFDAPVKMLFPKDLFAAGPPQLAMLGLGDIVIPGVFVALCLQYDYMRAGAAHRRVSFSKPYYTACFCAYVAGLVTTIYVMHTFKTGPGTFRLIRCDPLTSLC